MASVTRDTPAPLRASLLARLLTEDIHAIGIDGHLREVPVVPGDFPLETLRAVHGILNHLSGVGHQPAVTYIHVLLYPGFFVAALCRWYFGKSLAEKVEDTPAVDE
jgi:hypothetical protein